MYMWVGRCQLPVFILFLVLFLFGPWISLVRKIPNTKSERRVFGSIKGSTMVGPCIVCLAFGKTVFFLLNLIVIVVVAVRTRIFSPFDLSEHEIVVCDSTNAYLWNWNLCRNGNKCFSFVKTTFGNMFRKAIDSAYLHFGAKTASVFHFDRFFWKISIFGSSFF